MKVKHIKERGGGTFVADDNGTEAGLMTYADSGPDRIAIDHTEVNPRYQGKGVGREMVEECVKYARKEGLKVVPLCSFARAMFNRHRNFDDVLSE